MNAKNVLRFVAAIIGSWIVMWLGRGRLPEPLTQGLAFWVMFLILPMTFSKDATNKKSALASHILAATIGAAVVLVLNIFLGGWKER